MFTSALITVSSVNTLSVFALTKPQYEGISMVISATTPLILGIMGIVISRMYKHQKDQNGAVKRIENMSAINTEVIQGGELPDDCTPDTPDTPKDDS